LRPVARACSISLAVRTLLWYLLVRNVTHQ
jgi:hypothetical protein